MIGQMATVAADFGSIKKKSYIMITMILYYYIE